MPQHFTRGVREIVQRSSDEAQGLGARSVEPEHLLLGLAAGPPGDRAARALADAGLDAPGVRAALDEDIADALDVIGIPREVVAAIGRPPRAHGRPRFGPSAKRVLQEAAREAARRNVRRLDSTQMLLGVLGTPAPAIDRLLLRAGTDRARLRASVGEGRPTG
jgi:ATP-dependent Clp protease ATP-binding subunit ClpA